MADIRVTSTGKQFFRVDPTLAAILQEMFPEAVERVDTPPREILSAPNPRWGLWISPTTSEVCIQCDQMRSPTLVSATLYYRGTPENAHTFNVGGHTPPQEIIDAYAARYQGPGGAENNLEVAAEKRRLSVEDAANAQRRANNG